MPLALWTKHFCSFSAVGSYPVPQVSSTNTAPALLLLSTSKKNIIHKSKILFYVCFFMLCKTITRIFHPEQMQTFLQVISALLDLLLLHFLQLNSVREQLRLDSPFLLMAQLRDVDFGSDSFTLMSTFSWLTIILFLLKIPISMTAQNRFCWKRP